MDTEPEHATIREKSDKCGFCPHCGQELSPWQQVLLKVDRALVCKKCWYRIILDPPEDVHRPPSGH